MVVKVVRFGEEVARLTDDLKLISSRSTDFTILWDGIVSVGIPTLGPAPDALDAGVVGDVHIAIKPSASTIGEVEDYLNENGYAFG